MSRSASLSLQIPGFTWNDLHDPYKLAELHEVFLVGLRAAAPEVAARFDAYRASKGEGMTPEAISDVLVDVGPHVGAFVVKLFGVEAEAGTLRTRAGADAPVFRMKDQLVKRRAMKRGEVAPDPALDARVLEMLSVAGAPDATDEHAVAVVACKWLDDEIGKTEKDPRLDALEQWIVMHKKDPRLAHWQSLRLPHNLDFQNLVHLRRPSSERPNELQGHAHHLRARDGFALTDRRMTPIEVASEIDYCLYCHGRDKDSCSKGLIDAKTKTLKANPLGIPLAGCPLNEKISEAHLLAKAGDMVSAMAIIAIDNPMMPGTGHRICNDCMKACVFQKQEPVNIPQAETGILNDVLTLPWGFEIYGLLTRWNPLDVKRPVAKPYLGKNVLVVGLGPAGYTLVHHLVNEGFGVVGIDGLKLEPLPEAWLTQPIRDYASIAGELDERVLLGFGGVSEYGITVRWDKNFLTVIYLTLLRRQTAKFYGGVRFGGTLTLDDAWQLGFDHVAIAAGAGKPTIIELENNLIRGIRKASDLLMGLQLTGAYKKSTMANLQVRLPAVVIGGGLTAIDTATELRAYYVVQCEKTLARYETLVAERGEAAVQKRYDSEELRVLHEQLEHGRAIRDEREKARLAHRAPDFNALLASWGDVSIAYRKKLGDSPAYRLNHEEVQKALEEGIRFLEDMSPKRAVADEHGALEKLVFEGPNKLALELPARTLCVAAGTSPNTIYEKEHPGTFKLDKRGFFAAHTAARAADGKAALTEGGQGFFTSYVDAAGHAVSYYGDNHPKYAGSVVKAMASAKDGYPFVSALFQPELDAALADRAGQGARDAKWTQLTGTLDAELLATVVAVNRLTPTIVEVVIKAPLQAKKFHPGQFYRLQNFETKATVVDGTKLLMEGLALTGAWTDPDAGLLSLIVLEMGGSSRLCAALAPGEPVVVMGPTGSPTEIPHGETVLLAGGGLGNAVLFSIGRALKAQGNKVIYFAGYKHPSDVFKQSDIEAGTDQIVWSSDVGPPITPRRPQDHAFVGNIVQAMVSFAKGELGSRSVELGSVDRLIAIGSDRMMAAVAAARHGVLAPFLKPGHEAIGSINSPMQCMMKEVCAQCLQKHRDPVTGKEEIIFSCFNQDQPLDKVDWKNLNDRLRQNTVQEKLTNMWLDRLLALKPGILRV